MQWREIGRMIYPKSKPVELISKKIIQLRHSSWFYWRDAIYWTTFNVTIQREGNSKFLAGACCVFFHQSHLIYIPFKKKIVNSPACSLWSQIKYCAYIKRKKCNVTAENSKIYLWWASNDGKVEKNAGDVTVIRKKDDTNAWDGWFFSTLLSWEMVANKKILTFFRNWYTVSSLSFTPYSLSLSVGPRYYSCFRFDMPKSNQHLIRRAQIVRLRIQYRTDTCC